jgi:hypothetical protein
MKSTEIQVGGTHYKDMPIQPIEYILKNGLGFCEGNVVKYVSRWRSKGGTEDLKKAKHFLDMLIEDEEARYFTCTTCGKRKLISEKSLGISPDTCLDCAPF